VHLEVRRIKEQVVQRDVVELAFPPPRELVLDLLAHPRHRRLRQRRLGAERVGEGGLDIPYRQAAYEPSDHQRLQRVRLCDPGAEQPRGERLGGAAQLGPLQGDRPRGGLHRGRAVAVAASRAGILGARCSLVAGTAEELGYLRLQRGLDDQPSTEASDLLEHVDQVTVTGEQRVDLVADPPGGRYSSGHGRGSSFADWQVLKGTYVRRHLHRRWDTTSYLKGTEVAGYSNCA
jgi:hypothetical protein